MKKKIFKYIKVMMACLLITSLTLPSYAAVSASDGSAFVTKAEFDAALSDFNARLTTFEAGINSKIDSQVSSYLDRNGIWNGKEQVFVGGSNTHTQSVDKEILMNALTNAVGNNNWARTLLTISGEIKSTKSGMCMGVFENTTAGMGGTAFKNIDSGAGGSSGYDWGSGWWGLEIYNKDTGTAYTTITVNSIPITCAVHTSGNANKMTFKWHFAFPKISLAYCFFCDKGDMIKWRLKAAGATFYTAASTGWTNNASGENPNICIRDVRIY